MNDCLKFPSDSTIWLGCIFVSKQPYSGGKSTQLLLLDSGSFLSSNFSLMVEGQWEETMETSLTIEITPQMGELEF